MHCSPRKFGRTVGRTEKLSHRGAPLLKRAKLGNEKHFLSSFLFEKILNKIIKSKPPSSLFHLFWNIVALAKTERGKSEPV